MAVNLTTVGISAMIGVVIGSVIQQAVGGKRSSVGVHRRNGQIMPFSVGMAFFAFVTIISGLLTTMVSAALTDLLPGLAALIISIVCVSFFLSVTAYSR